MFILDEESDKKLDCVTILLTESEMHQLLGYAEQILEKPERSDHCHLTTDDYQKEITLCLYDPENINNFNPRIQQLIKEDR